MKDTTPSGASDKGGDLQSHLKTVHSFSNQLKPLRDYLNELLKLVSQYHEPRKRQALLDHIISTVLNHGNDGLKKHRALFIQGVKVLGGDSPTFSGFELDSFGYPRHYGDLFRLLKSLRKSRDSVVKQYVDKYAPTGHVISRDVLEKVISTPLPLEEADRRMICIILSILRWPMSIRLEHSPGVKKKILSDFSSEVSDPDVDIQYPALRLGEAVAGKLLPFLPKDYKSPLEFVPSSRTYKGGNPLNRKDRRLPLSVAYATLDSTSNGWFYHTPVGKASVLSERGGKSRIITSYDGAINSTNFYQKVRSILDNIPNDSSSDQSKGHAFLADLTSRFQSMDPVNDKIVSADLTSFTDKLNLNAYRDILDLINAHDFLGIICAPILVDGRVVNPLRSLMGLKGTFELASLVHHGVVRVSGCSGERNLYTICGDDIVFKASDNTSLSSYEEFCGYVGLELNHSKTVVSSDTGVFCGKVYHRGVDVTPVVPPLFTLTSSYEQHLSAAGNFISSSKRVSKAFVARSVALVKSLGKHFRGKFIPYALPFRLGGIGVDCSLGLINLLSKKRYRSLCRVPDEEDDPLMEVISVRYPHPPVCEVKVFDYTNNLLVKGYTKVFKRQKPSPVFSQLKDLHTILCYYYSVATV